MEANNSLQNFLEFSTANAETIANVTKGGRLYFYEDGKETNIKDITFAPIGISRGEGGSTFWHGMQDAVKWGSWLANRVNITASETYQADVDCVLDRIVDYYDSLDDALAGLNDAVHEIEQRKSLGCEIYFEEVDALEKAEQKLSVLQAALKSQGLVHLAQTALKGSNKKSDNTRTVLGYVVKEIKPKERQSLNYAHIAYENRPRHAQVAGLRNRINQLLGKELIQMDQEEATNSFSSMISAIFGSIKSGTENALQSIGSYCSSLCYDGRHLSKQHKWQLYMEETVKALEEEMGEKISKILSSLNLCNVHNTSELQELVHLTSKALSKLREGASENAMNADNRQKYREFVEASRQALSCSGFKMILEGNYKKNVHITNIPEKAFELMLVLGHVRFTKVNMNGFSEYLLGRLGVDKDCDDDEAIVKAVEEGYEKYWELKANRAAKKREMGKVFTGGFDSYAKSNAPNVLGTFEILCHGEPKTVTMLRMGCPTIDASYTLTASAEINPEFLSHLEYCKAHGKKHFYISLQTHIERMKENEKHRNEALIQLMKKFPETFSVVVLDNDSSFYQQSESATQSYAEFRKEFYERMLSPANDYGYYFPDEWKADPQFISHINNIMDSTAYIMFGDQPEQLTQEQRKVFIEICHAFLGLVLPSYVEADFMNVTCKDAIDRAMKMNSVMMEILAIAKGLDSNSAVKRLIRVMTHSPAVLTKAQSMNHHVHRLAAVRQECLSNDAVKDRIRNSANFHFTNNAGEDTVYGFPIVYNEEWGFHKPEGQRPSEVTLRQFHQNLKLVDGNSQAILGEFFNTDYLDALVEEYIEGDYFINPSDMQEFKQAMTSGLKEVLTTIASNRFVELDHAVSAGEMEKLSRLIVEMLHFAFLHPQFLAVAKSGQFSLGMLKKQLIAILQNPIAFLQRIDGHESYFSVPRSIPQKMFNHCLLNIGTSDLRQKIMNDPLFHAIEQSENIMEFMNLAIDVPQNPELVSLFNEETSINHALDMLVMGEEAVKLMLGEKYGDLSFDEAIALFEENKHHFEANAVYSSNIRQTVAILKGIREHMNGLVSGAIPADKSELHKFVHVWSYAMENMRKLA